MRQRTALVVAMVLTTFMLVIAAGVVARFAVSPASTGAAEDVPLTAEPAVKDLSTQGTVEYERALQTANAQLEQANRQLQEAYRRLTVEPAAAASPTPESISTAIPLAVSAEQAAVLAAAAVPGSVPIGTPEVVDFDGTPAYAVVFERGSVYVDANSGQVVYNEIAAVPPPSPPPAGTSSGPLPAPPATPPRITPDQAEAAARAYVGGGTVERVRLEVEHGQLVYDVRFTNDSRVYVDPVSGRVIYARLDDKGDKGGNDD